MQRARGGRYLLSFLIASMIAASPAAASDADRLAARLDALESRVSGLEARVGTLTQEKEDALRALDRQKRENVALKSSLAARPALPQPAPGVQADPGPDLFSHSTWAGVRAGYQGFPFKQKRGAFFYGAYLEHRFLDREEGMPYGDLDLEFGAGVALSGSDHVLVNSAVAGGPVTVEFRQRMISIWPALKYRLDALNAYGISPYLTGGPGVWVDIIETPPLVGGLQFPTQELAARKLPAAEGASLFEGGQGGAGVEFSLARSRVPVLERMKLGFDYRYSAWTTGQRFNTYSMLLSYSD